MTNYRPDIDGLRAIAVLPVVLFHAGTRGFSGGFVGVDIFFVISGFLITGVILNDYDRGRFSIKQFYYRRVLRLFPALFVMIAVVSGLAVWVLLPGELVNFAKSLLATTFFFSNILFYEQTGYFAPAAQTVPLLHTWSLSVEEQFYLFWPLLIGLPFLRGPWRLRVAVIVTVLSFALSVVILRYDRAGAFYLSPPRIWELGIGAILALAPRIDLSNRLSREAIAAFGILLIAVSIKFLNSTVPFPGEMALLPCIGAASIILAGGAGPSVVSRVLSNPVVVFVGKISYSVYLWHWPVILFAQTALLLEQTLTNKLIEIVVSILLGAISWRWVETPFRQPKKRTASVDAVLVRAGMVMAAFSVVGVAVIALKGLPSRFTPAEQQLASFENYDGDQKYGAGKCFIVELSERYDPAPCLDKRDGRPTMLLVGDSHAAHLLPGLRAEMQDYNVLQANVAGCQPIVTPISSPEKACRAMLRAVLERWLPNNRVDVVVLAGRWNALQLPMIAPTLRKISEVAGKVILIGPAPEYTTILPRLLVSEQRSPNTVARGLVTQRFALDKAMAEEVAKTTADYISLIQLLCPQMACRTLASPGVPMEFDYGHFTEEGSRVAVELMSKQLREFAQRHDESLTK
ncbi:MAG: acyltransferase [Bradyrhizobiaceae bacterium]|nr:MAG: acyltransferase [Bradyrhizobiaceae bacterium]